MRAWVPLFVLALSMAGCSGGGNGPTVTVTQTVDHTVTVTQAAPTSAQPITIDFSADETVDKLSVSSVSSGADWNRLTVEATSCTASIATPQPRVGGAGGSHSSQPAATIAATTPIAGSGSQFKCGTPSAVKVESGSKTINRNDYLQFCSSDNGNPAATAMINLKVTVKDTGAGNAAVYSYTFQNIADCS